MHWKRGWLRYARCAVCRCTPGRAGSGRDGRRHGTVEVNCEIVLPDADVARRLHTRSMQSWRSLLKVTQEDSAQHWTETNRGAVEWVE